MARLFDNPVALVILVLIIVVVFGWKRLPDAARSLGRSTRILKSELDVDGQSRASHETVQGEAKQQPSPQTGSVPGEAPPPPADQQPPPQGQQAPGQSSGHAPGQSSGQAPGQTPGQQGS